MSLRTLKDLDFKDKRVILRVDFNVPIKDGVVVEDFRVRAVLPTIKELIKANCGIVIIAHMGRPKGVEKKLSLEPVAKILSDLLKKEVKFLTLDEVEKNLGEIKAGEIVLVENIRFYQEEESNDQKFGERLAKLGEVYVGDAFGDAHRSHASVTTLAKLLPSAAGLLMQKEVESLQNVLDNPKKPLVAIIGGAKVSTKIGLLKTLMKKADILILGGAMANTFLVSQGTEVGKSVYEEDFVDTADEIMRDSQYSGSEVILPTDAAVSTSVQGGKAKVLNDFLQIKENEYIIDVGPQSLKSFKAPLDMAGTIVWNGPLGINEVPAFAKGTEELARMIATTKATKIVGGGETLITVFKLGLEDQFDLVSTGGGAMLDFLEGKLLHGVEVLKK